jgi:hypothetical protein
MQLCGLSGALWFRGIVALRFEPVAAAGEDEFVI